jgi:hypothetical protein
MKILSPNDERRLADAIERAITLTNAGEDPTVAMSKVAREEQFTPPMVRRVVGVFNKSLAVHRLRSTPSAQRKDEFPLADAETVISGMYPDKVAFAKEAAAERKPCRLPTQLFTKVNTTLPTAEFEKVASVIDEFQAPTMSIDSALNKINKLDAAATRVRRRLAERQRYSRVSMLDALDKVAAELRYMPKEAKQQVAQLVVNGYAKTGRQFLELLRGEYRQDLPEVAPTARAAVFPNEPVFHKIAEAHQQAMAYAAADRESECFEKCAVDFIDAFTNNVRSAVGATTGAVKGDSAKTRITPETHNALQEVDARRTFMDLALYDKDLQPYELPALIGAYNSAVQSVPEAMSQPGLLKPLMLQRINSGNVVDTFQLGQEQALQEKSLKSKALRTQAISEADEAVAAQPGDAAIRGILSEILKKDAPAGGGKDKGTKSGDSKSKDSKSKGNEGDAKKAELRKTALGKNHMRRLATIQRGGIPITYAQAMAIVDRGLADGRAALTGPPPATGAPANYINEQHVFDQMTS